MGLVNLRVLFLHPLFLLHCGPPGVSGFGTLRASHIQPHLPVLVRNSSSHVSRDVRSLVLFSPIDLIVVHSYNLRQVDISVVDVAFHRAAAVTVGVVWAAIVSRFWWPIEARRELGKALGE